MRVLYIHQYFVDPTCGAGGTRSFEFSRRLVADGHSVTMLTSTAFLGADRSRSASPIRFDSAGIDVVAIPVRYDNSMPTIARIAAFSRFAAATSWRAMRVQRPDLIVATSTPLTVAIPAIVARMRHRRPIVFEVRDLWPALPIALGYLRQPFAFAARALERLAYWSAEEVIALSPGMAAGVRRVTPTKRVTLIPNAADLDLFAGDDVGAAPIDLPVETKGRSVVTYAGTFGRANDVGWIVDVAKHLPEQSKVLFLLCGAGAERESIRRRAKAADMLGERIVMLDPVQKTAVPELLKRSALCLSLFADEPLLETTSPNKFFDGLAAGRPVAINYRGWQAEIIQRARCGIVLDRDPAVAAAQIADFMCAPDLEDFGKRAQAVAAEFSRDALYEEFLRVITRVARSGRSTPRGSFV